MDLLVCNNNFETIRVLDSYSSVIWTERYYSCGDFEINMQYDGDLFHMLIDNDGLASLHYIRLSDSETIMIVETITVTTDAESGNALKITGRSLESLLDRRVIYGQVEIGANPLTDTFESNVTRLITEAMISPENPARIMPGFQYVSSGISRINTSESNFKTQYFCDNLYETVQKLCETESIGFKVRRVGSNFNFQMYEGIDRSFSQNERPFILFSTKFDNLISSNYVESISEMKNVAIVAGEGPSSSREVQEMVSLGTETGLRRKELYVDGSDVSRTVERDGRPQTLELPEYRAELEEYGKEKLEEVKYKKTFDGEVESHVMYKYGVDYSIGDIVQVENEYGQTAKSRITEFIRSCDSNGYSEYPTFTKINE